MRSEIATIPSIFKHSGVFGIVTAIFTAHGPVTNILLRHFSSCILLSPTILSIVGIKMKEKQAPAYVCVCVFIFMHEGCVYTVYKQCCIVFALIFFMNEKS